MAVVPLSCTQIISEIILRRLYFKCCDDVIAALQRLVTVAVPELIESDSKNGCSNTCPALTRYFDEVSN